MLCAIWYHLFDLKNTHRGVLLLVKLQVKACNFTKSNTPPWVFFTFFNIVQMVPNRAKRLKYKLKLFRFIPCLLIFPWLSLKCKISATSSVQTVCIFLYFQSLPCKYQWNVKRKNAWRDIQNI